jgi:CRP-like cAMP-binding protein
MWPEKECLVTRRSVRQTDRPGFLHAGESVQPSAALAAVSAARDNWLLGQLPGTALMRLKPHLELVQLHRKQVLFRAHEPLRAAYFPATAVVSLVTTLESGESLEVGLIGRDGLAGTAVFPGIPTMSCDGIVRISGWAHRIGADALRRELLLDQTLSWTVIRYMHVLLVRSMQMSVCNAVHPVEQRCIRWMLTVNDLIPHNDRIPDDDIPLTHELLATMLGVRRPTVTLVLRSLHKTDLVREMRGRIRVQDRLGLESLCCECYRTMRDEQRRLLGY